MARETVNLFIYLGRRDKTGIRIIAKVVGREQSSVRLTDEGLLSLQLPSSWYTEISQIIYDDRMQWEPWIESVSDFETWRASLKKRGYSNIPVSSQPEFTQSKVQSVQVNVTYLPAKKKMLRKN